MSRTSVSLGVVALLCACSPRVFASDISGRIIIDKAAATKTVVPAVYDLRGVAVSTSTPITRSSTAYERVAVWLESNAPAPAPSVKALMRQQNQRLDPELLVIPAGSTVDFPNLDPVFHNIFSLSRTQSFDLGYYSEGHTRSISFPRPGIVQVYCHVHPHMHGVIVVTPSRWFGKPADDGTFSWSGIPPGSYRICAWQKTVGVVRRKVIVPEAGSLRVNMTIPDEDPEN